MRASQMIPGCVRLCNMVLNRSIAVTSTVNEFIHNELIQNLPPALEVGSNIVSDMFRM